MKFTFVETGVFTSVASRHATDEELRCLQCELLENPEKGTLLRGGVGIRKVRMAIGN